MTNTLSKIISDETFNRGIQIESAGNPDARPSTSSAGGLPQFLRGTWNTVGRQHYPELVKKLGAKWEDARFGKETTPIQLQMMARFWEDNAKIMGSTRDGDLYLAHFLGAGGARKVVKANQSASAVSVCGQQAADANKTIFYRKDIQGHYTVPVSCADLRAWADASMRKRWDSAGKKDWVKIWGGQLPPPPDIEPVDDKKPASPATKVAAGTIVAGTVAAGGASKAGVDASTAIGIFAVFVVVAVALFFIIRSARRG